MALSWLFGAYRPSPTDRPRGRHNRPSQNSYSRPRLESLEDRTLLSSGSPTHFLIEVSRNIQATVATNIAVEALDASNHIVKNYTGTVTLSSNVTGNTGLPATYTFLGTDHGEHDFSVKFASAGTQTLTATDTHSITGSVSAVVNPAPVVTHFDIEVARNVQAGVATNVEVEALDASNHIVKNYTGTVTLSSNVTGNTGLPATYTFLGTDHGEHTFSVTFASAGTQTLKTTDTATPPITGSVSVVVKPTPVATHFDIDVHRNARTGVVTSIEVEALDASNHIVKNYTGTVKLSSNVTGNTGLPATYTFLAGDLGKHNFAVTFATTGNQTLTATDVADAITSMVTIHVGQPFGFWGGLGDRHDH